MKTSKIFLSIVAIVLMMSNGAMINAATVDLSTGATSGGKNSTHDWDTNTLNHRNGDAATRHQDGSWSVTYNWDGTYGATDKTDSTRSRAYSGYGANGERNAEWLKIKTSVENSLILLGSNKVNDSLKSYSGTVKGKPGLVLTDSAGQNGGSSHYDGGHHYVPATSSAGGNGYVTYTSAADYRDSDDRSMQNGFQHLVREGSNAKFLSSTIGEADYVSYYSYDEQAKTWTQESERAHVLTSNLKGTNTGIADIAAGIYAFTIGFDLTSELNFLNGYISVLGVLEGVYLNGVLLDASLVWMGENTLDTNYAYMGNWDFELDLAAIGELGLLNPDGNNNLSFMVDVLPNAVTGIGSSWNHGLGGFVGDLALNGESIQATPVTTPEPATLLLFGSGLVGLALMRFRRSKKETSEETAA